MDQGESRVWFLQPYNNRLKQLKDSWLSNIWKGKNIEWHVANCNHIDEVKINYSFLLKKLPCEYYIYAHSRYINSILVQKKNLSYVVIFPYTF